MGFSQYRRIENQSLSTGDRHDSRLSGPHGLSRGVRTPRHASLLQAIRKLDTQIDPAARAELGQWVRDEYEREVGDIPLGLLAECFLGPPFVDHRLDLLHSIIEHFAPSDAVPEPFAAARMLARNGAYAFIEVYASGAIRPVLADGTVVA